MVLQPLISKIVPNVPQGVTSYCILSCGEKVHQYSKNKSPPAVRFIQGNRIDHSTTETTKEL